jgi:hypothetical protein
MKKNPFTTGSKVVSIATMAAALVAMSGSLRATRQAVTPAPADSKTVMHVLNRVGFGPRPGEVARIQAIGPDTYLDQQLHPERIDDSALDSHLQAFETIRMSTAELADKYFIPALQLRRDPAVKEQRAAAAAAKDTRPKGAQGPATAASEPKGDAPMIGAPQGDSPSSAAGPQGADAMMAPGGPAAPAGKAALTPEMLQIQTGQRPGSAHRFLAEPLQRLRRQGSGARVPDVV